ncbi:Clp protease N-terminal domain-containing protein [Actinokineospora iranica]|uniref:Clp amino terminal domain-containing protein, pathogenicity island component n=1 Tax=Actinokineospora iranica TaxID=1271860 RepID=A0A1G6QLV2_9PSEU|nr:Clp protease N-terminal domain-containing protein [Actinokineospora iranica]SDC92635.1 Clp amino terminal domain-containing protein, pathogenicity island component [Actinokineospora iranica]
MFERFTKAARVVVRDGVHIAETEGTAAIGPEHLLLGLLRQDGTPGAAALAQHAVTTEATRAALAATRRRGGLTEAEAAALGEFGIDVDAVVAAVEQTHGEGALAGGGKRPRTFGPRWRVRFSAEAKRVLEHSLREALDLGDKSIGDEHVLLAVLRVGGPAADALASLGVTYQGVRAHLARAS